MKRILFVVSALAILSSNLFAGAWPQEKGSSYYKLSFRFINAENFYNSEGENIALAGSFADYTLGLYAEYGLTDKLTFNAELSAFRYLDFESNPGPVQDGDDSESGIGDARLGVQHHIAKFGNTVLSGGFSLGIPLGKSTPDGELLLSSGDFNQSVNLQAGYSFYPLPAYLQVFLLYDNRTEGYSDEFRFGVDVGYSFYNNLSITAKSKVLLPMYNGRDDKIGGAGVLLNNQRYIAYGIELLYELTNNLGLIVFFENITGGKNILSAPIYTVGVFYAN